RGRGTRASAPCETSCGATWQHGDGSLDHAQRHGRTLGDHLTGPGVVTHDLQRRIAAAEHVLDLLTQKRARYDGRREQPLCCTVAHDLDGFGSQRELHGVAWLDAFGHRFGGDDTAKRGDPGRVAGDFHDAAVEEIDAADELRDE